MPEAACLHPETRFPPRLLTLAALLLLLPPLLISLDQRTDMHTMERLTLISAEETWLRVHEGEPDAWLIPTLAEKPRLRKPPLVVWLLMLSWSDLEPENVHPQTLIYRARLVSVALTILLIASLGWIGLSLRDRRLALLAMLAVGSMWFLQRQGRAASYDIHVAAWATLSVAAGLWAIRPFGDPPSRPRQVAGWLLSSAALAASWMSKNPLALLFVVPALLAAASLSDRRPWRTLIWLGGSIALAFLLTRPWYWYIDRFVPDAAEIRALEYRTVRKEYQGPHYYVIALLGLVAPWTIWFVAGLFQPLLRAARPRRRVELVSWLWFTIVFVAMSAHPAKQQRYILPLVASVALLAAQVVRDHEDDVPPRDDGRGFPLAAVHWISLLIASVLFAAFWITQQPLRERGIIEDAPFAPIAPLRSAALGLVLLLTAVAGWREHRRGRILNAAVVTSLWAGVLTTAVWWGYSNASDAEHPALTESLRVRAAVSERPLYVLLMEADDERPVSHWLRLFLVHRVRDLEAADLPALVESVEDPCIISWDKKRAVRFMESAGFAQVLSFHDGRPVEFILWRKEKAATE